MLVGAGVSVGSGVVVGVLVGTGVSVGSGVVVGVLVCVAVGTTVVVGTIVSVTVGSGSSMVNGLQPTKTRRQRTATSFAYRLIGHSPARHN